MGVSTRIRGLAVGLAITLGTTGLAIFTTGSTANAAPHFLNAPSVQIGYTDSATPWVGYDWASNVSMPIGARLDEAGVLHKSRVYATFDLTPFSGKRVISGTVRIREAEVVDCSKRAIEIWQTKAIQKTPSWYKAPYAVEKLDEILTPEFCPANISFDVGAAIQEAVRKGKTRVTFEIRVPKRFESDVSYGRKLYWFTSVSLNVQYNSLPVLHDQHMYNGGFPCDTSAPPRTLGWNAGWLQGMAADADPNDERSLITEFAVWPSNDPSSRQVYTSTNSFVGRVSGVTVPVEDLLDGQAYSWQYRAGDNADWTAWSKTCQIVVDTTRPPVPAVTSSNYPPADSGEGTPLGEPGVFTFSGGGNTDIVGFEWGFDMLGVPGCSWGSGSVGQHECAEWFTGPNTVRADVPGGSATVLINPKGVATNRLKIRAIDAAGNRSLEADYEFFAPWEGEPVITTIGDAEWNTPVTVKFAAHSAITGTTEFEYRLDSGETQTIAAGPDGTATFTFLANNENGHQITVRSHSANGWVSPGAAWYLNFYPWPGVKSDVYVPTWEPVGGVGVPGTFTFSPPVAWTEIKGYQYSINGGELTFIAAGSDGKASFVWTPEVSGDVYFEVWAVRPDDSLSDYSNFYSFIVA